MKMFLPSLGWAILLANLGNFIWHAEALPAYDGYGPISNTLFSESLTTTTLGWTSVETIPCTETTGTSNSLMKSIIATTTTTPELDETTYTTIFETFTETTPCSTSSLPATTLKALSTSSSWTTATVVESITDVVWCSTCANSLRTIINFSTETLSSLVPVSTFTVPVPKTSSASSSWTTITVVESITDIVSCSHCANSLSTIVSLTTETLTSLVPISTTPRASSSWTTVTVVESITDIVSCSTCVNSLRTIIGLTTETLTSLVPESTLPIPTTSTSSGVKSVSMWHGPATISTLTGIISGIPSIVSHSTGSHTQSKVNTYTTLGESGSATGIKPTTDTVTESWVASNTLSSATIAGPSGTQTNSAPASATETSNTMPTETTPGPDSMTSNAANPSNTVGTSRGSVPIISSTSVTQDTLTSDSTSMAWTSSKSPATSAIGTPTSSESSISLGASVGIASLSRVGSATASSIMSESSARSTHGPVLPTFTLRTSSIAGISAILSGNSATTETATTGSIPAASSGFSSRSTSTTGFSSGNSASVLPSDTSTTRGATTSGGTNSWKSTTASSASVLSDGSTTVVPTSARTTLSFQSSSTTLATFSARTSLAGSATTAIGTGRSTSQSGNLPTGSGVTTDTSSVTESTVASGISTGPYSSFTGIASTDATGNLPTVSSLSSSGKSLPGTVSVTETDSGSSFTVATTVTNPIGSLPANSNNSPSQASATTTSQQSAIGISSFLPTSTASNGATITGVLGPSTSQSSNPSISIIVVSGTTASYTATQIPSDATLTAVLTTTSTDASGSAIGIIIYPSASGWGWAFPCTLGCTAPPFPPQPSCPPIGASIISCYGLNTATFSDSVTSTMTTLPPGFSTEATTNTLWTGNTWLTTEVGGQQTILPVLVGCKSCGSKGGGLVLWNLPELPHVEFKLPGFPGLPTFHLPCIKIFGITISGDCNPPKTDDDGGNSNQSNGLTTTDSNTINPTSTSFPTSLPSFTSFSTTPRSSLSACSVTKTASDCSVICEATPTSGASAASGTPSCSTTCFATTTGCSATGTTTTATTTSSEFYCAQTCSTCIDRSWTSSIPTVLATGLPSVPQSTINGISFPTGATKKKRTLDSPYDSDYNGNIRQFFKDHALDGRTDVVWPRSQGSGGYSSATLTELKSDKYDALVWGLHGCTSIIIASEKAVYMSHFFEDPTFIDPKNFDYDVKKMLRDGDDTTNPETHRPWMEGLARHTLPGGYFYSDTNPTAIIVTPRKSNSELPLYPEAVDAILAFLPTLVPGLKTNDRGTVFLYDKTDNEISNNPKTEIGKVLIQYDPEEWAELIPGCGKTAVALIRIWHENRPQPVVQKAWLANVNQWSGITATHFQKRAGPTGSFCTLPSTSIQIEFPTSVPATLTNSATSSFSATTTSISSTISTSSASGSTATSAGSSLFCFPSSGPLSVPSGLPRDQIAKNVTDFCAKIGTSSSVSKGCDNQLHNGILLSADCSGGPYTTDGLPYEYPGITLWLNVSLIKGKSFIINSSTCNSAFSSVLNDCPPFSINDLFFPASKYGGAVSILDGAGGVANFNIILESANTAGRGKAPGCTYVIAKDLQDKALCATDYCNCGGIAAPLLTSTVSGSTTLNCAYSTKPATTSCPTTTATSSLVTRTTSTPVSIPSSGSGRICNCNEDGCSADSPACCADGTCTAVRPSQPSHRVRAFPTATVCNCNENSCTTESPPCCANGSCGT